jgi:hypothetical protein
MVPVLASAQLVVSIRSTNTCPSLLVRFWDKSWQNAKVESTCRSNRSVGSLRVWSNKHKRSEVFITSRNSDQSPQTRFCSWCHLPRAAFRTRLGTTVLARVLRRRPSVFSRVFPRGLAAFRAAIATAFLIQMRSAILDPENMCLTWRYRFI